MTQTKNSSEFGAKGGAPMDDSLLTYEPIISANLPVVDTSPPSDQYCLHLSNTCDWENIVVAGSAGDVSVFNLETMESVFNINQGPVAGIKCSPSNPNLVWIGLKDGIIKLWDFRARNAHKCFRAAKKETKDRALTCMDVYNDRLLCGGTELTEDGAFVIFWDVNAAVNGQIIGSYSNSHTGDLTQVSFSPTNHNLLATSSTDGLINIFDRTKKAEEDAFTYCLNVSTVPEKIAWLSAGKSKQHLAALTRQETLHYWDIKDASPSVNLGRQEVADVLEHPQENCYLVSADRLSDGSVVILTGGRSEPQEGAGGLSEGREGTSISAGEGDMLRSLKLDVSTGKISPYGVFLPQSRLLTTRTALYNSQKDLYVTGGECGVIRLWKSKACPTPGKKDKAKKKKNKP